MILYIALLLVTYILSYNLEIALKSNTKFLQKLAFVLVILPGPIVAGI